VPGVTDEFEVLLYKLIQYLSKILFCLAGLPISVFITMLLHNEATLL